MSENESATVTEQQVACLNALINQSENEDVSPEIQAARLRVKAHFFVETVRFIQSTPAVTVAGKDGAAQRVKTKAEQLQRQAEALQSTQ